MGKEHRRDIELEGRWRGLMEDQGRSGSSIQAFCVERQVSPSSFHFWKRELKRRDEESVASGRGASARSMRDFVRVSVSPYVSDDHGVSGTIEIEVGGAILRVRGSVEEEVLRRVVRVLRQEAIAGDEACPC